MLTCSSVGISLGFTAKAIGRDEMDEFLEHEGRALHIFHNYPHPVSRLSAALSTHTHTAHDHLALSFFWVGGFVAFTRLAGRVFHACGSNARVALVVSVVACSRSPMLFIL
jgi:hypothetical protein